MTDDRFFEFVYDEYKTDLALSHTLHQRAGLLLAAIAILAGAVISLRPPDLLNPMPQRIDAKLLQIATVAASGCLVVSTIFLFVAAVPRKYPKLADPVWWSDWRKEYWTKLVADDLDDEEEKRRCLADATRDAILEGLLESQETVASINEKRQRAYQWTVKLLALAFAFLGVQATCAAILKIQGV